MNWIKLKKEKPSHKDLVICKNKKGMTFPAIYYDNSSFSGFYGFTLFYKHEYLTEKYPYKKVKYKKFEDVVEWTLFPNY